MSDPVRDAQIDDVLCSIRRLVSSETRIARPDRADDPAAQGDRLLLGPALRVDRAVPADTKTQKPRPVLRLDHPENARAAPPDPSAAPDDPPGRTGPPGRGAAPGPEAAASAAPPRVTAGAASGGGSEDRDPARGVLALTRDDRAPDTAPKDRGATPTVALAPSPAAAAPRDGDAAADADDRAGSRGRVGNPGDAALPDHEALRDLVADVVREELQGVLGERITRNVRKLVRREVHRALANRDFD